MGWVKKTSPPKKVTPPPPAKVELKWHYSDANGEDVGPISDTDFKRKLGSDIQEDTYVWNGETVNDWTSAKDVVDLQKFFRKKPIVTRNVPEPTTWFYSDDSGNQVGPVTEKVLKQKIGSEIK